MNRLPAKVSVTLFCDHKAKTKQLVRWSLEELRSAIATTTADDKASLPWLKLARFGTTRSPMGSLRHDANVIAVSGIEGDYDAGELPLSHPVEILEKRGLAGIVYSSPSHCEDKPRWRVLAFTSQELQPHQRRHMAGRLNGLFRGIFARESFTLSQAYYFGSIKNNPSHQVHLIDGLPIDQDDDLDDAWIGPPEAAVGDVAGTGIATADAELIRQVVTGESYHVALCALAGRYVGRGMSANSVDETLRGLLLSHPPESRDQRWSDRFAEVGALVASAERKYRPSSDHRKAIASVAGRLIRGKKTEAEVLASIDAEAELRGISKGRAREIALWVAEQEIARRTGNA